MVRGKSRYFEIERLHHTTLSAVIHKMKAIFARQGIPERVISDNGPCYSSREFKSFAKHGSLTISLLATTTMHRVTVLQKEQSRQPR